MESNIPSTEELRSRLRALTPGQMRALAAFSGISVHTLIKIANGQTANPGIDTVRAFEPYIRAAASMPPDGRDRRRPHEVYIGVTSKRRETDRPQTER
jgi:transcriptional regulator with XRE-family HTH domain